MDSTGILVPFKTCCPNAFSKSDKRCERTIQNWVCTKCNNPRFIDDKGFFVCKTCRDNTPILEMKFNCRDKNHGNREIKFEIEDLN